jgi:hypothetical protein
MNIQTLNAEFLGSFQTWKGEPEKPYPKAMMLTSYLAVYTKDR